MTSASGIVWLASFPKSGNTWFRIFLANLAAGESGPADINNLDERGGISSSRHEFEAATMLDSGLLTHDEIDALRPQVFAWAAARSQDQRWVKAHDAYTYLPGGEPLFGRGTARAAIYLVRDPRDVAISLSHHNSATIDDTIKLMDTPEGAFCGARKGQAPQLRQKLAGWSGHVTGWLDQTDIPVLMLRYEDLLAAPHENFAKALDFAGRSASAAEIERAIKHADFKELRRQEDEKGFAERMGRNSPFFRSGRSGGWRDTLTREQALAIEQAHAAVMARLGYEPEAGLAPTG